MKVTYAEQYQTACITLEGNEAPDDVIEKALDAGATFQEEPGEDCYILQFPGRPKELYTESAIRRSLKK